MAQAAPPFVVESVAPIDVGMAAATPKWSPDGQWIAFAAPKMAGIGIVRPDGTGLRMLTTEAMSGYRFAWSPDSSRIVFRAAQRDKGPRQYIIRVVEVANGAVESSTGVIPGAQPPTWERGPQGIRWVSHAPASGPLEGPWRVSGKRAETLTPPRLVQQGLGLWLHDADPAKRRKLSEDVAMNPAWNPDGHRLAFDAMDRFMITSPDAYAPVKVVGLHPAWSPDGNWIVYQLTRDHSHEGEDQRQHTPDTLPHVHDDKTNHRIVDSELWIIAADGTGRHQLTKTPEVLESDPDWALDGRRIVCHEENTGKLLVITLAP